MSKERGLGPTPEEWAAIKERYDYVSPYDEADIKEARMNIRTEHIYPPIPHRGNDWCAWIDGSDEETRLCGWGATEEAAIADLKMLLEDLDD